MADLLLLVLPWLFSMASCAGLVLWDRSRIPQYQRDRGWNSASFGSAVFAFAPLCIIAHFWVTRRSVVGVLLGIASLVALLAAQVAFNLALAWLLGV